MIKDTDFYLLRAPIYPFDKLCLLNAKISLQPKLFSQIILEEATEKWFTDAIYIASKSLYQRFKKYGVESSAEEIEKFSIALYKYLCRMCYRSTPFGLFSGVSLGTVTTDVTSISISAQSDFVKKYNVDSSYLQQIAKEVVSSNSIRKTGDFYVNNTLYKLNNDHRYVEYALDGHSRIYRLSALKDFPLIDDIINEFTGKPLTLKDFLKFCNSKKIAKSEAEEFFGSLIDHQILVSSLEVNVTGIPYLSRLLKELPENDSDNFKYKIARIENILTRLNNDLDEPQAATSKITESFPEFIEGTVLRADLLLATETNQINHRTFHHITATLKEIIIAFGRPAIKESLDLFKHEFLQRYDLQELPLSLVMDPDCGISYGSAKVGDTPLTDGMFSLQADSDYTYGSVSRFKRSLINQSVLNGYTAIVLSKADLDTFKLKWQPSADTSLDMFYALGSLIADSNGALDRLEYKFELKTLINNNAANLINRFSTLDPSIASAVEKLLYAEEKKSEYLTAEIVNFYSGEGNITFRPSMRQYEIPFVSNSALEENFQLPINDLYVSIRRGKVLLRSKKLNKFILPRLTTAHNFNLGLPVYRFLCDLQAQDKIGSLNWSWNDLNGLSYLPRVEFDNVILSRARWTLDYRNIAPFTIEELALQLANLQRIQKLPRYVGLENSDNELLLDLNMEISCKIIYEAFKNTSSITLVECLYNENGTLVRRENTGFCNEMIIPFTFTDRNAAKINPLVNQQASLIADNLLPGLNCLYFKIYCGENIIDTVLTEKLKPVINEFLGYNANNYWFFVRYKDPNPHLRIRFFATDTAYLNNELIPRIYKALDPLIATQTIYNIQIDTYKREIARYGTKHIGVTELLFCKDSSRVLEILSKVNSLAGGQTYRIMAAILLIDAYIGDFYNDQESKLLFAATQKNIFAQEFSQQFDVKGSLKVKVRKFRPHVAAILSANGQSDDKVIIYLQNIVKRIKLGKLQRRAYLQLTDQLPSYIHMCLNRIFMTDQRLHEMIIYDLLENHYRSILNRKPQTV